MMKTEAEITKAIREQASILGACRWADSFSSFSKGARILFQPQVLEFCVAFSYPSLPQWEDIKESAHGLQSLGIFINTGEIEVDAVGDMALIGSTKAIVRASGCDRRHTILLMHGAAATIIASRYAVVKVEKTPDCNINIIADSTSIVL